MSSVKKIIEQITQKSNLSTHEAWWLLEHICNKTKIQLLTLEALTPQEQTLLIEALNQITIYHKPLAYIIGSVPFLDLSIEVQPPMLIPRHETEEWVDILIKKLQPYKHEIRSILDIGTGSGCIALTLAKALPDAHVIALDINPNALQLAQKNATYNSIKNITFLQSDLFENVPKSQKFDLIVSNPPYIDQAFEKTLPLEVANWEDHKALFAPENGLEIIEKILKQAPDFLHRNSILPGQLIIEIDYTQKNTVLDVALANAWKAQPYKDSFGKWRTIWCKRT